LAGARGHWNSPDRPRSVVASAGTSSPSALAKGQHRRPAIRISIILEIPLTTWPTRETFSS
jgi:hypothetical protein